MVLLLQAGGLATRTQIISLKIRPRIIFLCHTLALSHKHVRKKSKDITVVRTDLGSITLTFGL